jgi:hypothetical protein
LESKVRVLVLVVSELRENSSFRIFVGYSISEQHHSLGAQVLCISLNGRVTKSFARLVNTGPNVGGIVGLLSL